MARSFVFTNRIRYIVSRQYITRVCGMQNPIKRIAKETTVIARKKRNWYPGEILHIMNRGAAHHNIFHEETDYLYMIELIKLCKQRYDFTMHAYCLMTNHYHFLIETYNDDIAKIMKLISEFYTRYFNMKYHRDGPLFRGRYKSCEVVEDSYFLQSSRYISLNPVKAHMVELPEQYRWSSYKAYITCEQDPIAASERTLRYFKDGNSLLYKEFVEAGIKYDQFAEKICLDICEDDVWLPW